MNYREARVYLDDAAKYGSVLGLENMRALMNELGNPQDRLKFIHISGTNGKGSVLAYLTTILKEAGCRVGRYISPTLFSYRERIQVDETYIEKEAFARHVSAVKEAILRITARGGAHPTPFEIETAVSFLYFLEQKCDIAVMETGLGGDTDATNIIKTTVMEVLVPISMDHMQFLGETLTEIAAHKAGIIKPGTVVVSAQQEPEAMEVIRAYAKSQQARLRIADRGQARDVVYGIARQSFSYGDFKELVIPLAGTYQIINAVTAVEAVLALRELGWKITEEQLRSGLAKTVWNGRFTVIHERPLFIIDGAHNRDGARMLQESIEQYLKGRRIFTICGVFRDKEYEEILKAAAPYTEHMITIQTPGNPRALPAEELAEKARGYIADVQAAKDIDSAVRTCIAMADKNDDAILAFGSLSFLKEIREAVQKVEERKA